MVLDNPSQPGHHFAEPVLSYLEHKRYLLSKIPEAQRPPLQTQISTIIDGLIPALREKLDSRQTPPATVDELTQAAMQAERAVNRNSSMGALVSTSGGNAAAVGTQPMGTDTPSTCTTMTTQGYQLAGSVGYPFAYQPMMGSTLASSVPLDFYGKPSVQWAGQPAYQLPAYQASAATAPLLKPSSANDTDQLQHKLEERMDQKFASLQESLASNNRELQASFNAFTNAINTQVAPRQAQHHYGPAGNERSGPCESCGRLHYGKC